ncbi:ATP-binding protein [Sinomonas sp. ASV322]|uniref:sensor histidine kinase n=1 Tax=Sinomonas sp. ASV322 TaxID=3041920 RepID=UPI0027DB52C8|nr:ATP-binding protein [Sinomonas sp. ASV322]MDQ4501260.1 ATP-binding protein [Sinomonas sp. ASV322]
MEKLLDVLLLGRLHFHELNLTGRVLMSQLPLNLTMLLVCAIVAVADPRKFRDPSFLAAQALAVGLFALCAVIPWRRLPYGAFLVIPFLDFIPVSLVRSSASDALSGLGLLAVFPVLWVAGSGYRARLMVLLGGVASLVMVWEPLFAAGTLDLRLLVGQLVTPIMMLAVGIGASVMTVSGMTQQSRVEELLDRSETREHLLDTVLETVDVGVIVLDAQGKGMFANSKQIEVYAAAMPADGVTADRESEMLIYREGSEAPLPPEQWALERALAGEEVERELYRLGAGPAARTVSVTVRGFVDAAGERAGTVVASSDVTDVVAAVRARDRFLSIMSHEFRTPIANIMGYAEMVQDDPLLSPTSRADLEVISRNAQHVNQMVDDILEAASGRDSTEIRLPLDLAELVREAGGSSSAEAKRRGIRLSVETDGALPILGDRTGLVRILDNLVSNALKYSGSGTEIALRASRDGEWAVCAVEDHGMGIASEDLDRIFTRFGRSASVIGTGIPGTGLGLALAREVAEKHGGTIECTSEVGVGSTFTVRLPLRGE